VDVVYDSSARGTGAQPQGAVTGIAHCWALLFASRATATEYKEPNMLYTILIILAIIALVLFIAGYVRR
jgi:hypothetical protein